jgi:hypothetical protein
MASSPCRPLARVASRDQDARPFASASRSRPTPARRGRPRTCCPGSSICARPRGLAACRPRTRSTHPSRAMVATGRRAARRCGATRPPGAQNPSRSRRRAGWLTQRRRGRRKLRGNAPLRTKGQPRTRLLETNIQRLFFNFKVFNFRRPYPSVPVAFLWPFSHQIPGYTPPDSGLTSTKFRVPSHQIPDMSHQIPGCLTDWPRLTTKFRAFPTRFRVSRPVSPQRPTGDARALSSRLLA